MSTSKNTAVEFTPVMHMRVGKRVVHKDAVQIGYGGKEYTIGWLIDNQITNAIERGEIIDTLSITIESADWDEIVRQFGEYSNRRAV